MKTKDHKPIIETIINSIALASTATGVVWMTTLGNSLDEFLRGLTLIFLGMGLEFFKYKGRQVELW